MNVRPLVLVAALTLAACTPTPPAAKAPQALAAPGVTDAYRTWVLGEADAFLTATEAFAQAIQAGDRAKAQALYAPARMHYERIEPIAEALGDLDPRIDAREETPPQENWTGYHRLEKALWSTADLKSVVPVAQTLVADVRLLRAKVETADIQVPALVTGAVELLNEVSATKVTGEEDRYSHTDLYDFVANVQGAEKIWSLLKPVVTPADADLSAKIDARFTALLTLLEAHKKGDGYQTYDEVDPQQVKALSAAVDALSEPLAQLGHYFPAE